MARARRRVRRTAEIRPVETMSNPSPVIAFPWIGDIDGLMSDIRIYLRRHRDVVSSYRLYRLVDQGERVHDNQKVAEVFVVWRTGTTERRRADARRDLRTAARSFGTIGILGASSIGFYVDPEAPLSAERLGGVPSACTTCGRDLRVVDEHRCSDRDCECPACPFDVTMLMGSPEVFMGPGLAEPEEVGAPAAAYDEAFAPEDLRDGAWSNVLCPNCGHDRAVHVQQRVTSDPVCRICEGAAPEDLRLPCRAVGEFRGISSRFWTEEEISAGADTACEEQTQDSEGIVWTCTRVLGHQGSHLAGSEGIRVHAEWAQVGEPPEPTQLREETARPVYTNIGYDEATRPCQITGPLLEAPIATTHLDHVSSRLSEPEGCLDVSLIEIVINMALPPGSIRRFVRFANQGDTPFVGMQVLFVYLSNGYSVTSQDVHRVEQALAKVPMPEGLKLRVIPPSAIRGGHFEFVVSGDLDFVLAQRVQRKHVRDAWEKLRAEQVPTPPEWKDEPSEPLFAEDERELDLRSDQLLLPLKKHLTEISPGAMERFAALELGEERPYEQRLANKLFALTEDAHDPLYILGQALYRHRPITEEMLKKAISRLSHDDAWSPEVRRLFAGWDLLAEVNDLYNQMFEPERPIVPELELNPCGGHHHRRGGSCG